MYVLIVYIYERTDMSSPERSPSLTRRGLLGASAAALGASAGCLQETRSIANRDPPETTSLTILTTPTDNDELATAIADEVATNLDSVGIDTSIEYLPPVELYREVLLNGDFELFVGRLPAAGDPDALRPLLHSVFAEEPGWQNPYSFVDIGVDGALDNQRTSAGQSRQQAVANALRQTVREQPFATIGFTHAIRAVRTERFTGWDQYDPHSPLTYLALEPAENASPGGTLTLSVTDSRLTRNRNPLAVEYRDRGTFLGLLYDPLCYRAGGESINWLAADLAWSEGDTTSVTVTLRSGQQWHDGRTLSAGDVAFTYRFLQDTSLGGLNVPVPAPRFRGRTSLVETITVTGPETVEIEFGETSPAVARRALTTPILPEHIWRETTDAATLFGDKRTAVTEALVADNEDPVGSGPLQFESADSGVSLTLSTFDEHFLYQNPSPALVERFGEMAAFDRLELQTAPSDRTALSVLSAGNIDATAATVSPSVVPRIGEDAELSLLVQERAEAYHIGYNTAVDPLSNARFRRLLTRLIDKEQIVSDIFHGYGDPASNPFDGTGWTPDDIAYDGTDPETPFIGTDGEVDVPSARAAFRAHGFEFNENGDLIRR
jgi:peptide/nickel transport system substrate-binding protein